MPMVLTPARRLFHRARGMVHPLIESFVPVTYTDYEVTTQKLKLDPTSARNDPLENVDTDRRVRQLADTFGFNPVIAGRFLDEAREIRFHPNHTGAAVPSEADVKLWVQKGLHRMMYRKLDAYSILWYKSQRMTGRKGQKA